MGTQTSDETVSTSDSISILNHTASMSGGGILEYSATGIDTGGLIFDTSTGEITADPDTVTADTYTVVITAKDDSANCLPAAYTYCQKSFDSFTITVNAVYDARGFSLITPFLHRVTNTLRDLQGYNSAGFDATGWSDADPSIYNEFYDEDATPS